MGRAYLIAYLILHGLSKMYTCSLVEIDINSQTTSFTVYHVDQPVYFVISWFSSTMQTTVLRTQSEPSILTAYI